MKITFGSGSFTASVPSEYIAVLKLFAAKNDARNYLNGINLELSKTLANGMSEGRITATDGHRLGIFKLTDIETELDRDQRDIIIPNDLLKLCKANTERVIISVGPPSTNGRNERDLTISQGTISSNGKSLDGRYPDCSRIIPATCSGVVAQFNAHYIGELSKCYDYLHSSKHKDPLVTITHNGQSGALIDLKCPDFIGVLMPQRGERIHSAPAWAFNWPIEFNTQSRTGSA